MSAHEAVSYTHLDVYKRQTLSEPLMYMFFLPITAIPDYAITDVGPVDYTNLTIFDPILNLREQ